MLSIKSKIIMANLIIFGIALIAFGLLTFNNIKRNELAVIDSKLQVYATKFALEFEDEIEENIPELNELIKTQSADSTDVKLVLMDTSGTIILSNIELAAPDSNLFSQITTGKRIGTNIRVDTMNYRDLLFAFGDDMQVSYVLRLLTPLNDYDNRMNNIILFLMIGVPLTLIITSLAVYFVTKSSFRPLTEIANTAEKIGGRNLETRLVLPRTKDEIRKLAESLNLMMDRIEQAFESQRQFIANASHELRTPLTIINSELEYARRFLETAKTKESIDIARNEVDRLSRISNQLLTLVKIDTGKLILKKESTRLDELITECVKSMTKYASSKGIRINLQISRALEVIADKENLKGALINILDNAIQYSQPDSDIEVILSALNLYNNTALLKIRDHGAGIAENDLPYIFDRFYRSEESRSDYSGSGLGLAIVKDIIELHEGKIMIESKVSQSTTVLIYLPLV